MDMIFSGVSHARKGGKTLNWVSHRPRVRWFPCTCKINATYLPRIVVMHSKRIVNSRKFKYINAVLFSG
ncbi:Uncharacterized protein APZ42_011405 [Daphnia magna]|uniref:Uncharacterized protein n=1 Tax=Daphnia magna TaxID=35525 RepID=A0A162SMW0_9CRUS|nr:Uncharacterized protein APZ42_011405 [Daphnia magna]